MLSVLLQRGCLTAATTRAGRGFVAAAGGGQPKGSEADDAASGDGGTGSKAETANETYANYSTANEAADDNADLDALVTASLRQVPALGWTGASIRAAVAELGWSPAAAGMLPGGGGELALRFVTRSNEQLADDLAPLESATSPSPPEPSTDASTGGDAERSKMPGASTGPPAGDRPARLQHAVRARLGMVAPYHHNWGAGLLQLARPPHTGGAARQAAVLADEIAHFAGYDDPQFGWYTDRAAVSAMYTATELFWITDKSPGHANTWGFLEATVERAEGLRSDTESAVYTVMSAVDLTSATMSSVVRSFRGRY